MSPTSRGRHEVYVRSFPGPGGGRSLISIDGGSEPRWRRDGRELFYPSGERMMAVALTTTPVFRAEEPRLLFEGVTCTEALGLGSRSMTSRQTVSVS